jgi:hypothetical protein
MPVFGADPDSPTKEWDEATERRQPRMNSTVYNLVQYFGYHRHMRMSQRFDNNDRAIIAKYCSTKLANGFTVDVIKDVIDKFYASPYNSSDFPALMFSKREVQDDLLKEVSFVSSDEVLQWIVDGMPDDGPLDSPREMRKAVLTSCDESLHRYPDVVADILRLNLSEDWASSMLSILEDIILWVLGEGDRPSDLQSLTRVVSLPDELGRGYKVAPSRLRKKSETVSSAVANVPKKRVQKDVVHNSY